MADRPRVLIHADESCLGNQFQDRANPGGAGGLVETWRDGGWTRRDYWLAEPDTTNNRMALRSAIEGLRRLNRSCEVQFVSDSQYLIRGMNEWVDGWRARGWKRKSGKIENLDLWKELVAEAERHGVSWKWVRGHAEHPKNEYANHLATLAASEGSESGGLVESGFLAWIDAQRDERGRFLDYEESAAPQ